MIYLDMDGCIADFSSWVLSIDPNAFEAAKLDEPDRVTAIMVEHYKECFREFEFIEKNRFLLDLPEPKAILTVIPTKAIVRYCGSNIEKAFDVIRRLKRNKLYWCEKYLGYPASKVIFCNTRSEKIIYATPGSILYDDDEETVRIWNKYSKAYLIK